MEASKTAGKRIVNIVYENVKPDGILTLAAFRNAVVVLMVLGGSTNALLHLTAIAGRLNIKLYTEVFDEIGSRVPCITNVQLVGYRLIDEFDEAGGIPAAMQEITSFLDLTAITYTGLSLGEHLNNKVRVDENIIRTLNSPITKDPTIAILRGNLAPGGAVIKVATASRHLLNHTGKAFVFNNYHEMLNNIDDDALPVDVSTVLILRNAGPRAVPGMPEWGMIPIQKRLQKSGVTDIVRITDARMSGTSFGTVRITYYT